MQKMCFQPDEVLVYLRKSRSDDPALSVEEVLSRHEEMLDQYGKEHFGGPVPEENKYREVTSGETIRDRPAVCALLCRMEEPRYKAVLLVEVQRLSRGDLEDAGRLIKLLRYTGTAVLTLQKSYDLEDDFDRDFFERELKRGNEFLEYTKRIMKNGRLLSLREGNYIGSVPPYGYEKIWLPNGRKKYPTLREKEPESTAVRLIFKLYTEENLGYAKIARHLQEMGFPSPRGAFWSGHTVSEILMNVHYTGMVKWNGRKTVTKVENGELHTTRPRSEDALIYKGKHPPLISMEMFTSASEKRGRAHREKRALALQNPLSGLLFCRCGRTMTMQRGERGARLYCPDQKICKTGSFSYDILMDFLEKALIAAVPDLPISEKDETMLHKKTLAALQKKLENAQRNALTLWERSLSESAMPEEIFERLREKNTAEQRSLTDAIQRENLRLTGKEHSLHEAFARLICPEVSAEAKNAFLKALIERIDYTREAPLREKNGWSKPPISLSITLRISNSAEPTNLPIKR